MTPSRKMFVNLPVRDLKRSVDFFTKLGFTFDPKFTDENATCMIVGGDAFVMLLVEPFFKTFTKRQLCDTRTHTEGLFAISVGSRADKRLTEDIIDSISGVSEVHNQLRVTQGTESSPVDWRNRAA